MIHELKTDPEPYDAISQNKRRVDIRIDDRDFAIGDILFLRQTRYAGTAMARSAPLEFTGEACYRVITHCLRGEEYGILKGFVALSVRPLEPVSADK